MFSQLPSVSPFLVTDKSLIKYGHHITSLPTDPATCAPHTSSLDYTGSFLHMTKQAMERCHSGCVLVPHSVPWERKLESLRKVVFSLQKRQENTTTLPHIQNLKSEELDSCKLEMPLSSHPTNSSQGKRTEINLTPAFGSTGPGYHKAQS